ncbi:MAG: UDP-N-acetylmuramate--L-alanine ligase [Lactobacillales bacterium]|nr:UDP-N-acetylmuramate--L-alanine ligase [Lactobacillales bacterium]
MYHFVGIKGAGMSSLAQIMKELGYNVQGSDVDKHFFTEQGLIEKGIEFFPYDENNIKENMKIVKGESIKDDHPEIVKANELGLDIYSYVEMVGKLTNKFKTICVAGCHGKTTTTSMMSLVLNNIKGANYLIGDGTGYAALDNEFFVLESCEYKRHFLEYNPYYAVITNIDLDHVDYYKDIDDVIDAYQEFANKAEKMVIACGDDPYTHSLEINPAIFYYGLDEDNDIRATNVNYKEDGTSFEVEVEGNYYGFFDLPIYGKHMLLDALAVIAICYYERIDAKEVSKIFKTFKGAKRRFSETIVGENIIIDDYAHHPNEVKATLKAIKQKYPKKEVVAIFQPHTFTRTEEFADDLVKVLNIADKSYIMDIHPAREKQEDYPNITSNIIIDNLDNGYHINIDEAESLLNDEPTVYIFMSPNDISKIENDLIEKLKTL